MQDTEQSGYQLPASAGLPVEGKQSLLLANHWHNQDLLLHCSLIKIHWTKKHHHHHPHIHTPPQPKPICVDILQVFLKQRLTMK